MVWQLNENHSDWKYEKKQVLMKNDLFWHLSYMIDVLLLFIHLLSDNDL